jgi:acyl transferase domain-containing protein/NADPH:quinone reductase-like Zn-dependent oxidoreductase
VSANLYPIRFLSGDGKSYAFDSRASGYGRGEGVATIIVKLLKDALAVGDPIQGVIRESLLNQDGKTETITTPSLHAQKSLISGCYLKAGLDPRETQYFEAHGTGTQAGDTVEAQAIASIFGANANPLLIGSIKTNIGHTEAASGLASIIKTAVALEKGIIPATINFENANPQLSLEKWNLKIVQETQAWPEATIRRASINNFGYGGTNAHIIMENAARWAPAESNINQTNGNHPLANGVSPEIVIDQTNGQTDNQSNSDGFKVLVLSARDEQACQTMASNLGDFLEQETTTHKDPARLLDSIAYTLGERRTRFPWVAAHVVPNSVASVIETLRSPKFKPSRTSTAVPRIGMVFTGQGAQWFAMGRELAHAYPVYQESLQEAEDYLKEFGAKWKLLEELSRHLEVSKLNEVALSTPICVAVQISLVRLLRSWGVVPTAVTSHSSGEIAAAYAAGALSYRAAMSISYHRAALAADPALQGPVKGGMIAVGLGESDTEAYLSRLSSGKAVVACINSPSSTTVAGDVAAVIELESLTKLDNVFARRLKVDTAWHSHHMAPVADAYIGQLEAGRDSADTDSGTIDPVAFSSPVTGGRMANFQNLASPRHWVDSLLQPVQFVAAFTDMVLADRGESASNVDVIVEIGPHTALGGPIQDIFGLPAFEGLQIPYYGSFVRNKDARETMLALAANLLRHGCTVDLGAVNFPFGRGRNVKVLTDLPSYPWNHRIKHWVEPRENRALRQRSIPPHNLLGTLVEGCNPDAPSWRHVLRISESPWVCDHMIQSNVVYPAAGYMCLAIEAIRQNSALKDSARAEEATGYSLREVEFMQALLIPESSDGIEIQTTMRLVDDKTARLQGWMRFEVWTVTPDNDWTQHAEGLIMAEYDNSSFERVQRSNTPQDIEGYARRFIPADLFMNLRALGITHGPMFQNMSSIVQSGSSSSSVVTMAIPDTSVPKDPPQDHVLHPVSLDSIITAPYSAMPEVAGRETSAKVPRAVQSFWVSARIRNKAGYTVKVHSSIIHEDEQDMKANVTAFDQQDGTPILEMRSFSYLSLGRALSLSKGEDWQTQWCSNVRWSLDMSFTSPATFAAIKKSLKGGAELDPAEASLTDEIRRVCIYFMQKTLLDLEPRDIQHLEPQHARYYSWMKDVVRNSQSDSIEWRAEDEVEMKRRVVQIARAREDAEMVCHLGPQLTNILRGEMTPLEIMMQNELLFRYQRGTPWLKHVGSQLAELLSHLTHKNPRSRILEIGAGHGALTRYALEVLGTKASGGPQAESYHFTDISDKAFETCQTMFAEWNELLSFHVLDIGHEPAAQGFLTGTYDIVIASHVLLSDQDGTSLINIRGLLKANGVLLATEDVDSQINNAFVNGLLPGWKFGEQRMKDSPSCHAHWNESLRHAGFAGIQLDLRNGEDINNYTSGVVMTRVAPAEAIIPMHADLEDLLIIISNRAGAPPFTWLESLRQLLSAQDEGGKQKLPTVHDLEFDGATPDWYSGKICIFVGELDEPILYELDAAYLEALRAMSTGCQALLWVTSGGAVDCERPEMSLATGFVRTLRTEYIGRKLVTLDLDPKAALWSDNGISAIAQIVLNCELGKSPRSGVGEERGPQELEFAERDGVILIPRLYHDVRRNKAMSGGGLDSDQLQAVSMEAWLQPDRPLRWNAKKEAFCDDTYAEELHDVLLDHLVEVEPRAYKASLEARDQRITGWDCAGIVTRVGITAAAQGVVVGDRVMCLVGPGQAPLANHTFFDWRAVVAMPKSLTFEEAASLPSAFLSAYFCLVCTARLKPAQKVLIHDASSDVGQAAIMLAQHIGADITAVVDDDKRRSAIARAYAIPSNRIFESEDKSWIVALLEETQGRGVDVVLNTRPILPPHLIGLVASHGWFVQAGQGGVADDNKQLVSQALTRGISLTAFDASSALEHRGQDVQRCLADIARLFETKALKPDRPITSFGMGEMAKASALLHDEAHVGNVVLMCGSHDTVPVLPPRTTPVLSPSASYLIVGGSGGLGQSVAHWLVARGARNLILMSRNAAKSTHTAALAKELHRAGCDRILPVSCDVANEDDLAQAIHMCAEEGLPPIRGVVHAAFVLRVSIYHHHVQVTD